MAASAHTPFERAILQFLHLPLWLQVLVLLLLLGFPFALAALEGSQIIHCTQGWRGIVFPVVGLTYIVFATPWIGQAEKKVVQAVRPLANDNVEAYDSLSSRVWWRSSVGDWVAFAVGFIGGLWLVDWVAAEEWHLVDWYLLFIYLVLYGGVTWLIYAAGSSARLTAMLHRHIRHEDPFDLSHFEPVGRQGLLLSLIFAGGITISLPFVYIPYFFLHWQYWVIYSILLAATVFPFFLVMWPTHRTLLRAKMHQLAAVERLVGQTSAKLQTLAMNGADTLPTAIELQTWLALEQRLKYTHTWPYDTEMLRTLFLSVLTPLFVGLGRVVGTLLAEQRLG